MRTVVIASCLVLQVTAGSAQPNIGIGAQSCGEWARAVADSATDVKALIRKSLTTAWVQGYVLGATVVFGTQAKAEGLPAPNYESVPDIDSVELWLTKHCKARPLDAVARAATELYGEVIAGAPKLKQ